jgi:hypothetical protein
MFTFGKFWGSVLVLGAFLICAPGSVPVKAAGTDRPRPHGSDYLTFAEELRTSGALKFYEETEDMLRAGKFERAFTRYLFLRANIKGQPLYTGLAAGLDQRLQFLRGQMHLGEETLKYEYVERPVKRRRVAKQVCPPPAKKPAKAKEPAPEEKPPEMIIPPAPVEEKATTPPKEEAKPAGEGTAPAGEKAQKPAPTPTPSPSFWEKFKRRLKFW